MTNQLASPKPSQVIFFDQEYLFERFFPLDYDLWCKRPKPPKFLQKQI